MRLKTTFIGFAACLVLSLPLAAAPVPANPPVPGDAQDATLPLTTNSPKARQIVLEGMNLYLDQVKQDQTIEILRKAVKLDPDFAMAHEFLAWVSLSAAEQV